MSKVAFIGLGVMGYPMAGHLSKHYDTIVYNRTTEKSKKWIGSYNGKMALSITNTVKEADYDFFCVRNDNHIRSVLLGQEGVINSMKKVLHWLIILHVQLKFQKKFQLSQIIQRLNSWMHRFLEGKLEQRMVN